MENILNLKTYNKYLINENITKTYYLTICFGYIHIIDLVYNLVYTIHEYWFTI